MELSIALNHIRNEVLRAKSMYPENFHNQHEAYAVILEEVDELWTEIKRKQSEYNLTHQAKEAIQAAAMLVRFITELIPEEKLPKSIPTLAEFIDFRNDDEQRLKMVIYAYRSSQGIHQDMTFLTLIRPRLMPNGRFYNPASWIQPVSIKNSILNLGKGTCITIPVEKLQKLIAADGGNSPELDELEAFEPNSTKPVRLAMDRVPDTLQSSFKEVL